MLDPPLAGARDQAALRRVQRRQGAQGRRAQGHLDGRRIPVGGHRTGEFSSVLLALVTIPFIHIFGSLTNILSTCANQYLLLGT